MQPVLVNPHRRFSAVATGHAELAVSGLALPPNVIRLPRGPDKSKGFQRWCKTRMQPSQQASASGSSGSTAAGSNPASNPAPAPSQPRKSRAIPIVAPPAVEEAAAAVEPEAAAAAEPEPEAAGAAAAAAAVAAAAVAAQPANNFVVNLESSDSDEGHFSDHDLDDNERTR